MTDEPNQQFNVPRRRQGSLAIGVIGFGIVACAAAYAWLNYGEQVRSTLFASPSPATAPAVVSSDRAVTRSDLDAVKEQMADSLKSVVEAQSRQNAGLTKLSNQVAALTARIDAMQTATSSTSSTPFQTPSVAATPAVSAQPTVVSRKKPIAPKPAGPISVGGAPLSGAPN